MAKILCIRILYLIMDNEQYNELLEYLLNGQLPQDVDETYGKWASQFREQNNHIYVEER